MKNKSEILYWFCNTDDLTSSDIDNIETKEITISPEVRLFKLASGDFQVIQIGEFKAILGTKNYILIRRDIAQFLSQLLPDQLEIRNTTIHRNASGQEWSNYSEILIHKEIRFEEYHDFTIDGLQIYKMFDSLIYVTSEVRNKILEHFPDLNGMTFKQGIPLMAG